MRFAPKVLRILAETGFSVATIATLPIFALRFAPKVLRILAETGLSVASIATTPVVALRFAPKVLRILAPGCSKRRRRFGLPGVSTHHGSALTGHRKAFGAYRAIDQNWVILLRTTVP